MANLFDIEREYLELAQEIEDNFGEVTDELMERFNINRNEFATKLNAYRYIVVEKEAEIDVLKGELKRLKAKIDSKQNTIDRLKGVMTDAILLYGNTNKSGNKVFETTNWKFSVTRSKKLAVQEGLELSIMDDDILPVLQANITISVSGSEAQSILLQLPNIVPEFKVDLSIDKDAAKDAIEKEGVDFAGKVFIDDSKLVLKAV